MKELHDRTLLHTLVQNSPLPDIFDAATLHEMRLYQAEKGDILCLKGDQLQHMYFILKGKIKPAVSC
ncbi:MULTISPECIES: hypothetical protein [unclassified Brevibacillus]|uniref:hypothetical protein n=1 Tax=unclassified Brevibacillus TaxID=2684853 RepID=UPI003569C680